MTASPWGDPDWQKAELAWYRAELRVANAELADAQQEVDRCKANAALIRANHRLSLATIAELGAGTWNERRYRACTRARLDAEDAHDAYMAALERLIPDRKELRRRASEARHALTEAWVRANAVERS